MEEFRRPLGVLIIAAIVSAVCLASAPDDGNLSGPSIIDGIAAVSGVIAVCAALLIAWRLIRSR